jgi:hypothetical protein
MSAPGDRIGLVSALGYTGLSIVAAFVFFVLARWVGDAPPLAIVGGTVWVFILSMIISMPLVTGLKRRKES